MANDPKKFRIPKEFTLFGHRYTVLVEKDLFEKRNCYGIADDDEKKIRIQCIGKVNRSLEDEDTKEKHNVMIEITDEVIIETFYHELFHIIFYAMGENDLAESERLVNMVGKSMLEVYLSSVYEETVQ